MNPSASLPIGIFDSGMGGLTVLKAISGRLPGENLLYLGDTARLPYGTKSRDTIIRYTLKAAGRGLLSGRAPRRATASGQGHPCPDCGRMAFFRRQGKGKRAPEAYGTHFSCPGASYRCAGRAVRAARIPATDSAGT